MNLAALMGRLTADPDVRRKDDGKTVARYTLAVDRRGEGADFIRCVAFDKAAEFVEKYLSKGTKIAVKGSIHTDSYTDRDGKKVYTTDIHVSEHYFCERKEAQSKPMQHDNSTAPDGFMDAPEGVPFA